ncbi:MAG: XRE family transcriptional regulator [Bacteroidetes bacterium RIFCSPHIGHO2_02_FULL_44_7]|nr:MAG: XRE family transcriptional regulator [Bacteroidetes bacterium RIFCSPHIGHO2_02_FULL_44_7]
MKTNKLKIDQLSRKLTSYKTISNEPTPSVGWVKTIRTSIGMSLEQLGNQLGITKQSAQNLEKREAEGSITIKALEEAGRAVDMRLVYGFIPVDGSLEKLIEKRAQKLAAEIVMRTSATMKLEGQENSPERIKRAIAERKKELIEAMPKILWD